MAAFDGSWVSLNVTELCSMLTNALEIVCMKPHVQLFLGLILHTGACMFLHWVHLLNRAPNPKIDKGKPREAVFYTTRG